MFWSLNKGNTLAFCLPQKFVTGGFSFVHMLI